MSLDVAYFKALRHARNGISACYVVKVGKKFYDAIPDRDIHEIPARRRLFAMHPKLTRLCSEIGRINEPLHILGVARKILN